MKNLLFSFVLMFCASSFAQSMSNGTNSTVGNIFEFKILESLQNQPTYSTFKSDKNNYNNNYIQCVSGATVIQYITSSGNSVQFHFDDLEKCQITLACIRNKSTSEIVSIKVNRETKRIESVNLPVKCSLDPWTRD